MNHAEVIIRAAKLWSDWSNRRRGAIDQRDVAISRIYCIEEIVIDCGVDEFVRAEAGHVISSGDGERWGILLSAEFENLVFDFLYYDGRIGSLAGQFQRRMAAAWWATVPPEWKADVGDITAVEVVAAESE